MMYMKEWMGDRWRAVAGGQCMSGAGGIWVDGGSLASMEVYREGIRGVKGDKAWGTRS